MSLPMLIPGLIGLAALVVVVFGLIGLFKAFYVKVPQGTALIVNDLSSTPKVHFTGALVIPVLYKAEQMQIKLINLDVDRRRTGQAEAGWTWLMQWSWPPGASL